MKTKTLTEPKELVENPEKFTDIYFTDSKKVMENEEINPNIKKKVFARTDNKATTAGLQKAAETVKQITEDVDIYINTNETFESKEPLMVLEGPLQQILEPETINLGIISQHLTEANPGYEHPEPEKYGEAVGEIAEKFKEIDIPFADFGARHYHPEKQEELGYQAIKNGAETHSTIKGAQTHGKEPSGTMPHAAVLPFKYLYGEKATLEAAKAMDRYKDGTTPVLVDTNNQEKTDTLEVCEYMEEKHGEDFELLVRMDTCGENYAETAQPVDRDDGYQTGKGMNIDAVKGLSEILIEEDYRENVTFAISSGFGNPEKVDQFVDAYKEFEEETGYPMFDLVGAGSFKDSRNIHATSDIYEVEGDPVAKVGREQDLDEINRYIDENMKKVV